MLCPVTTRSDEIARLQSRYFAWGDVRDRESMRIIGTSLCVPVNGIAKTTMLFFRASRVNDSTLKKEYSMSIFGWLDTRESDTFAKALAEDLSEIGRAHV